MALSGNFRAMSAAELLQFLSLNQKTGTLHLSNGQRTLTLVVGAGRLLSSASSDPQFHLGAYLQRHGYLGAEERARALQIQEESRVSLGAILVKIELLTKPELIALLRQKAEDEICDLFQWDEAEFVFQPDELPSLEMHPLQLDLLGVIMEASRQRDEAWRVAAARLPIARGPVDDALDDLMVPRSAPLYFAVQSRGSALRSYHAQGCRKAHPEVADQTVGFDSKQEAERLGLRPCKTCKP